MALVEGSHFIHNFEIRALIAHLPTGDLPGYEIRFQIEASGTPDTQPKQWTPWMFCDNDTAVVIAGHMQSYFRTQGHLQPPGPVQ